MFCAFFGLLMLVAGVGALLWFVGRRVGSHLSNDPQAAKKFADTIADTVIVPLLRGDLSDRPAQNRVDKGAPGKANSLEKLP